jgi:hypothetical protein
MFQAFFIFPRVAQTLTEIGLGLMAEFGLLYYTAYKNGYRDIIYVESEANQMNKQQLAAKIWQSANKMRSKIEANEYKDYILGFIFYKFLSDKESEPPLQVVACDLP